MEFPAKSWDRNIFIFCDKINNIFFYICEMAVPLYRFNYINNSRIFVFWRIVIPTNIILNIFFNIFYLDLIMRNSSSSFLRFVIISPNFWAFFFIILLFIILRTILITDFRFI